MHPALYAARLGLSRGWTEFRLYLTNPQDLVWNLFFVAVFGVVLLFQRNATVEGSTLPLATLTLPSIIGMWVAVAGYQGAAGWLAVEREDGTLPWGAIIGSLVKSPNSAFGVTMLPIVALTAISGIFYPITALPGWVQGIAQCFPIYWLGLGIRSGLLPDAAAAVELSGSWRHLETAAVLGAWALAGLLIAPVVLRRMARRESGSSMEARRLQHQQRI
jgi:ABC-2 type transporter